MIMLIKNQTLVFHVQTRYIFSGIPYIFLCTVLLLSMNKMKWMFLLCFSFFIKFLWILKSSCCLKHSLSLSLSLMHIICFKAVFEYPTDKMNAFWKKVHHNMFQCWYFTIVNVPSIKPSSMKAGFMPFVES